MAISVVLNGPGNDAAVLESALRFAAQQHCVLRVFVGVEGDAELIEKQLDFARWFLETRHGLTAPQCVVQRRQRSTEPVKADELKLTGGDSWL